jgi:Uma2 family endonuclease
LQESTHAANALQYDAFYLSLKEPFEESALEKVQEIPKILIYEEFNGHPIYRKGYKDYVLGLKKIEEINRGTSLLQWIITNVINRQLMVILPRSYRFGPGELGLNAAQGTNFSADIAIYREGILKNELLFAKYAKTPPSVVIEVDIKADESDYFTSEEDYFHKKTERLLQWGVERVIWVFSSSRRILVADNLREWRFIAWDLPFTVIDEHEINLWELMLEDGFES